MGLPSYTYSSAVSWFQLQEESYSIISHDATQLLTQYTGGLWIPSASDIASRTHQVLNPQQSILGVTLDNSGWQSRITVCEKAGNYSGATIKGVGFWQIGMEDPAHHELSAAARSAIQEIQEEEEKLVKIPAFKKLL
jgi:hypothetical protein